MSKDPRYPLGVPKDRRHNSTVRAHEAFLVGQGIAKIIWREASGEDSGAPDAAYEAAGALLEIYARVNGLDVEGLVDRIGVEFDPSNDKAFVSIGEDLAIASLQGIALRHRIAVPHFEVHMEDDDLVWDGGEELKGNPPWRPIGVEAGGRYQTYYRDGRKSWAFEDGALASDWAKEIKGRVVDAGPAGYAHYGRQNPVGDRVDVMQGPGRGRSGVVESETKHVARVRFDRGGGAGHLERSALRTRGRSRD